MKKTIILLSFLMAIKCVNAQIPIGTKYDLSGTPFNGYFDSKIYNPEKKITKIHNSSSYEIGHIFNKSGEKISGQIMLNNKAVWFKGGGKEYKGKLKPEEIKTFIIGVDSFFTISKYNFKNKLKNKPTYVQYVSKFENYTVAKYYHLGKSEAGSQQLIGNYLIKSPESDIWENFTKTKNFKEKALKYFGNIPYLKKKISSGKYVSKDMLSIIKIAEYNEKYKNKTPIFYDKYWQETRNSKGAEYKAIITNKVDSIWTFEYYNNETKLYQSKYSSFYPNTKNGDFIAYYPSGDVRQIIKFSNNKPKEVKVFTSNGKVKTHYKINKTKDGKTTENEYVVVNDSLGNNIIKNNGQITNSLFDKKSKSYFESTYSNKKLKAAHRIFNNDKIIQITNSDFDINIKKLQKKFNYYMNGKNFSSALKENAQGIILVSVIIDKNGYLTARTRLNGIHVQLDKLIDDFVKQELLMGSKSRFKFNSFKQNKIKSNYEVVIPFEFKINKFYREYSNNHHMYYSTMHTQFTPSRF